MRITLMLPQQMTFTTSEPYGMVVTQRLMRITSMLPQEGAFTISLMQQSMRMASMLQQEATFITLETLILNWLRTIALQF